VRRGREALRRRGRHRRRNASTIPGMGNVLILAPPFIVEEHECVRIAETIRGTLDT